MIIFNRELSVFKTDSEIEELTPFRLRERVDDKGSEIDEEEQEKSQVTPQQPIPSNPEPQSNRSVSRESSRSTDTRYSETHPQSNLFSLIDRNSDGRLTLTEFIQALRTQPAVSKVTLSSLSSFVTLRTAGSVSPSHHQTRRRLTRPMCASIQ
jgi:hypothetical protein